MKKYIYTIIFVFVLILTGCSNEPFDKYVELMDEQLAYVDEASQIVDNATDLKQFRDKIFKMRLRMADQIKDYEFYYRFENYAFDDEKVVIEEKRNEYKKRWEAFEQKAKAKFGEEVTKYY